MSAGDGRGRQRSARAQQDSKGVGGSQQRSVRIKRRQGSAGFERAEWASEGVNWCRRASTGVARIPKRSGLHPGAFCLLAAHHWSSAEMFTFVFVTEVTFPGP